jgi:hypothetical protein
MEIVVVVNCLRNNDKDKSPYVFSTDAIIFSEYFHLMPLVHSCKNPGYRGLTIRGKESQ